MSNMSLNAQAMLQASHFAPARQKSLPVARTPRHIVESDNGLEQMRVMLSEAEFVIRSQEERIRQLEDLAMTDELTGLLNRRGLMLALRRELGAARRDKGSCGMLIMVDLDGFKQINDQWGHATGDSYLQCVSAVLMKEVRSTDIVARLGGDEFAIILTRIKPEDGHIRLAALEKAFGSSVMYEKGQSLPLRASFGSFAFNGSDNVENIMAAADLKLYAHKARHRAYAK